MYHAMLEQAVHGPLHPPERELFIANLLVRTHLIIEKILVDLSCAMGIWISFSKLPNIYIPSVTLNAETGCAIARTPPPTTSGSARSLSC